MTLRRRVLGRSPATVTFLTFNTHATLSIQVILPSFAGIVGVAADARPAASVLANRRRSVIPVQPDVPVKMSNLSLLTAQMWTIFRLLLSVRLL